MLRPPPRPPSARDESGQAAVEFIALLPLVALLLALGWQAVLAAHAAWAAAVAARAAARAAAVAQDPVATARARLGGGLAGGAEVHDDGAGHVTVSVRVPSVIPGVHVGRVAADGSFRPQEAR